MDLVRVATSRFGPAIATALANLLPLRAAYGLADLLARLLSTQKAHPLVRALRCNMALVHGRSAGEEQVTAAVYRLLKNQLRCYVDLYRAIQAGPHALQAMCALEPESQQVLQERLDPERGLLLVGTHTCSFDMLLMALPKLVPSVQALTKAQPKGSTEVINRLRSDFGLEITPISRQALKQAIARLRDGGAVAIAADLPEQGGQPLEFMGRLCEMPVGHARLAIQTGAQVVACTSYRSGSGQYLAKVELVDPPPSSGNRRQDAIRWAQAALKVTESFIRERPDHWFMPQEFHPLCGEIDSNSVAQLERLALTRSGFGG